MTPLLRRLLGRLLRARGLVVERIDEDAWLLQRQGAGLQVHRIGPARMRTHVLTDEDTLRNHMNGYQNQMGQHLGEEHLAWVFRELGVTCVLDVGANLGQFATRLRRAGYTGRIVSFEPVAHLVSGLRRAAADDPAWTVLPFALGAEDGTAEINVVPGKMSSLLPASSFGKEWSAKLREPHTETITIRRLDSVYDEAVAGLDDPRVFLKMDTQGFDLQTVRGAGSRLDDIVGLQSEVSCVPIYDGMPRLPEQLTEYEAAGFAISAIFPVTRHRPTLRAIELDVVMVRPEAVVGTGGTPPGRPEREPA